MKNADLNNPDNPEAAHEKRRPSKYHDRLWGLCLVSLIFFIIAAFPLSAWAGCPSVTRIKEKLERLTRNKVEVIAVQKSALAGICEVAFRQRSKMRMAYIAADGGHFLFGRIFEADTGRNLTDESLAAINRMTDRELEELGALTAFSIGSDSAQVLYYVTDPQCPYCKRGEKDLEKMAAQGEVYVRFLMLPLEFHKGSKEQCVSVICDKKGLAEFEKGYRSKNQCEEGRMLVESTVDFLKKKGIRSTPTYIFTDGRIHSGLLRANDLERWLKRNGKVLDKRELKAGKGPRD